MKASLNLDSDTRRDLWNTVLKAIEQQTENLADFPIVPSYDVEEIRSFVEQFDLARSRDPRDVLDRVIKGMTDYQLHTGHPRFFGHFMPGSYSLGAQADALVAAFNPQLATWRAAPFAVEVEQYLLKEIGRKFGYDPRQVSGSFTSGGSESSHTGLVCAVTNRFEDFAENGFVEAGGRPVMYVSSEAHLCHARAARLCGLGAKSVRVIGVKRDLTMDTGELRRAIQEDRERGMVPFYVVGTAGTTSAGVVDPLEELADVSEQEGLWFHLDAAWGGAAIILEELSDVFRGAERADSITFDAHKWFFAPMAAGMFITRREGVLEDAFKFVAPYIDLKATKNLGIVNPHYQSMQWSRRFAGLKLLVMLASMGWEGLCDVLREHVRLGDLMRQQLADRSWKILNEGTKLPTVCFVDTLHAEGSSRAYLDKIVADVVASGEAWLFCTQLSTGEPVLRGCLINHRTTEDDVWCLLDALDRARANVMNQYSR